MNDFELTMEQLRAADAFFDNVDASETTGDSEEYVDSDGIIQFIVAPQLVGDPNVQETIQTYKGYVLSLLQIGQKYMNKKYPKLSDQTWDTWNNVLNNLPLLTITKRDEQTYDHTMEGIEISTQFLEFLTEAVLTEGESALAGWNKFLNKQGKAIRFGADETDNGYHGVTHAILSEVIAIEESPSYIPKLKMYFIEFDRENTEFTSLCGSTQMVHIRLVHKRAVAMFNYGALENDEVKNEFLDFLAKKQKAEIEDADTFFEDEFELDPNPENALA